MCRGVVSNRYFHEVRNETNSETTRGRHRTHRSLIECQSFLPCQLPRPTKCRLNIPTPRLVVPLTSTSNPPYTSPSYKNCNHGSTSRNEYPHGTRYSVTPFPAPPFSEQSTRRGWERLKFWRLGTECIRVRNWSCGPLVRLVNFVLFLELMRCRSKTKLRLLDMRLYHTRTHIYFSPII